jgi:hypothetical protein
MLITYNIEVDDSGKVIVTADASIGSLPKGERTAFSSGRITKTRWFRFPIPHRL